MWFLVLAASLFITLMMLFPVIFLLLLVLVSWLSILVIILCIMLVLLISSPGLLLLFLFHVLFCLDMKLNLCWRLLKMRSGVTLSSIADPDTFFSSSGSRIRTLYSPVVDGNSWHLVESGKQDIQDLIDSYRDLTDMSFIMSRLAAGDSSVINVPNSGYGDSSLFPADPASLLNIIQNAQNLYDRLPDNVRSQFGSFRDWFSSSGTPEWSNKMQAKIQNSPNNVSAPTIDPSAMVAQPVSNPISESSPASSPASSEV